MKTFWGWQEKQLPRRDADPDLTGLVAAERAHNREARMGRRAESMSMGSGSDWSSGSSSGPGPPGADDPPPF